MNTSSFTGNFSSIVSFMCSSALTPDLLFGLNDGQGFGHQFLVDPAEVRHFVLAFVMDVHAALCRRNPTFKHPPNHSTGDSADDIADALRSWGSKPGLIHGSFGR